MNPKPASLRIYLVLLITLVVLRILLVLIPLVYMDAVPGRAALFTWSALVSVMLLRLFLLPLPVWLLSSLLLRGRWQEPIFWTLAVATSVLEPLGNLATLARLGWLDSGLAWPVALLLFLSFGINLLAAYLFRTYGFVSALSLRLGLPDVAHWLPVNL